MEKGRGLQALREVDPLARRLEIEKKELYAQELREQMAETRRRKEMTAPPRSARTSPIFPSDALSLNSSLNSSLSCPTLMDKSRSNDCELSPPPITGRTTVSSALTGSVCSPIQPVGSCASNDTIEKVAQLQEMMRSRLRAVENKVNEQWVMIQAALQDHVEVARESAEEAARRQTEILRQSLDSQVEMMQHHTSETAGRKAEETIRDEMRRTQVDLQRQCQEEFKELRDAISRIREEFSQMESNADQRRQGDLDEIRSLLEHARNLQDLHDKICRELEREKESKVEHNFSPSNDRQEQVPQDSSSTDSTVAQRSQRDWDSMCSLLQQLADDVQQFRKDTLDTMEAANKALELATKVDSFDRGTLCLPDEDRIFLNQLKTDLCATHLRLERIEQSHKSQVENLQLDRTSWQAQLDTSKCEALQTFRSELNQFSEESLCQQKLLQDACNIQRTLTEGQVEKLEIFSVDLRECRQLNDLLSTTATQLKTDHIELKEQMRLFPDLIQNLREEISRHIGKLAVRVEMAVSATSMFRALPPSSPDLNASVAQRAHSSVLSKRLSKSSLENRNGSGERLVRWMS